MEEGTTTAQTQAVRQSVEILKKNNISNHLTARENLVWAPNRGHSNKYAATVLSTLSPYKSGGRHGDVVDAIRRLAEGFVDGTVR